MKLKPIIEKKIPIILFGVKAYNHIEYTVHCELFNEFFGKINICFDSSPSHNI